MWSSAKTTATAGAPAVKATAPARTPSTAKLVSSTVAKMTAVTMDTATAANAFVVLAITVIAALILCLPRRTCLSWRARASHLRAAQKTAIIGAGVSWMAPARARRTTRAWPAKTIAPAAAAAKAPAPEGNAFASSAGVVQIALPPCAAMAVAIVPSQVPASATKASWGRSAKLRRSARIQTAQGMAPAFWAPADVRTAGPVWHASSMYLHRVPWVRFLQP
mmetsp:Transcript_66443/g.105144  ORF Transcript_66443/g.105144 Transcript_66443/m.105144 type:complete len:221 (-) Transcript_66443:591-1253(-)